jgi:hypothetical protein
LSLDLTGSRLEARDLAPSSVAVVPSAFADAERYGALAEADAHAAVLVSDAASPKCSPTTDGQVWVSLR